MTKNAISVLLICDAQQQEIETILSGTIMDTSFSLLSVSSLAEGLKVLEATSMEVVLLIITPTASQETSGLVKIRNQAPGVPVVVIVESSDTIAATNTLRAGAQDVLIKQDVTGSVLARSLLYAIERQRVLRELQTASLIDELTGLYNRRGFMNFARDYLQVAGLSKRGMVLFYADLDNMKFINDNFGHQVGDEALVTTANMIKGVFRTSDIIARIGGDEFVALALDAELSFTKSILGRLREKAKDSSQLYLLSLSVGFAYYDPETPWTIEELLARADKDMYANKRAKKAGKREYLLV